MECNTRQAGQEGLLETLIFEMGPGSQGVCLMMVWGAEGAPKDPEVGETSSEFEEDVGDLGGSSGTLMADG